MKNRHVAIFTVPLPVLVNPTLTIVTTLVRRGYKTSYVISERYAAEVSRLGAEVIRTPRFEPPFTQDPGKERPIDEQYSIDPFDFASRTLERALPQLEKDPPDLILYDSTAFAGLIAAKKLGVPAIRMSPQLALDEENVELPIVDAHLRQRIRERNVKLTEYLAELGFPGQRDAIYGRRVPSIYFYCDEFQLNGRRGDGRCIYAGRCAPERPHLGQWRPTGGADRNRVLVSTSTMLVKGPEYYRQCLSALGDMHWHAIVATGGDVALEEIEPLPHHCEPAPAVPQLLIMPHVDLIMCLGGMATTLEAMYHGLPMLMMTNGYPEAELYADNVQDLGLGIHLRSAQITTEGIRESVAKISSDRDLRQRVADMQTKVRRSPGGEEVVNWIEAVLTDPGEAGAL